MVNLNTETKILIIEFLGLFYYNYMFNVIIYRMREYEQNNLHEDFAIRSAIFQVFRNLDQFIDLSNYINNKPR